MHQRALHTGSLESFNDLIERPAFANRTQIDLHTWSREANPLAYRVELNPLHTRHRARLF